MKTKIIITLLILNSLICLGQEKSNFMKQTEQRFDSVTHFATMYFLSNDTIPMIMLVSDTSHYIREDVIFDDVKNDTCQNSLITYFNRIKVDEGPLNHQVRWMKGYGVRGRWDSIVGYLDSKKNKLDKNIVVWLSKKR
jgi:hypothetical protein